MPPSKPDAEALRQLSGRVLGRGSSSFSHASRLFPAEARAAAALLYHWCRYCDDRIDETPEGTRDAALRELEAWTDEATRGRTAADAPPPFQALAAVMREHQIPQRYPRELLQGLEMDVRATRYASLADLRLYAYRVAGTVALMMTHILGASSAQALPHAAEMGIAMQLTNVARDVKEDLARGRLYLPERWVRAAGLEPSTLTPEALADPGVRGRLFGAVTRVLEDAEASYRRGFGGLRYLPRGGVFAVSAAAWMYRSIGRRILEVGPDALLARTVVSRGRRRAALVAGAASALPIVGPRIFSPWTPTRLPAEWSFQS